MQGVKRGTHRLPGATCCKGASVLAQVVQVCDCQSSSCVDRQKSFLNLWPREDRPSSTTGSASVSDKRLEVLRKDQSCLKSTSTARGGSSSTRRLHPAGRAPSANLLTCREVCCLLKSCRLAKLSSAWLISPCCSPTWAQILWAATEPLKVSKVTLQVLGQGGISTILPLEETGSERCLQVKS